MIPGDSGRFARDHLYWYIHLITEDKPHLESARYEVPLRPWSTVQARYQTETHQAHVMRITEHLRD